MGVKGQRIVSVKNPSEKSIVVGRVFNPRIGDAHSITCSPQSARALTVAPNNTTSKLLQIPSWSCNSRRLRGFYYDYAISVLQVEGFAFVAAAKCMAFIVVF